MAGERIVLAVILLLCGFILVRKHHFVTPHNARNLAFLAIAGVASPIVFSFGYYVTLLVVAALAATIVCA